MVVQAELEDLEDASNELMLVDDDQVQLALLPHRPLSRFLMCTCCV